MSGEYARDVPDTSATRHSCAWILQRCCLVVYSEGMPKRQKQPPAGGAKKGYLLTLNQVVSHNLARARRSRGWTQEEAARRLHVASGKDWTAARLSASERSIKTGRPRVFDANELVTFSRAFEYPVAYFLLPIEPVKGAEEADFFYALVRPGEEDNDWGNAPLLQAYDLLSSVVPLRYPAAIVDAVNRLLRPHGTNWQPEAHLSWDNDDGGDYHTWHALNHEDPENPISLDEWETIQSFAEIVKKHPAPKVLRLLADAAEASAKQPEKTPLDDPPF